jgi:alkaline phosphatase D
MEYDGAAFTDRSPAGVAAFRARINDPARQLMGAAQRQWFGRTLTQSRASGRVWQVIGNQVVMARVQGPDIRRQAGEGFPALLERQTPAGRARLERNAGLFALDLPLNLDAWDGYPAEREQVYALMRQARARPIVLAGDVHSFWANNLHNASGARVGVESAATSITSPSSAEVYEGRYDIAAGVAAQNPREVVHSDWASKGFLRLTLRRGEAIADLMAVSTITERAFTTRTTRSFRVRPEADGGTSAVEPL